MFLAPGVGGIDIPSELSGMTFPFVPLAFLLRPRRGVDLTLPVRPGVLGVGGCMISSEPVLEAARLDLLLTDPGDLALSSFDFDGVFLRGLGIIKTQIQQVKINDNNPTRSQ